MKNKGGRGGGGGRGQGVANVGSFRSTSAESRLQNTKFYFPSSIDPMRPGYGYGNGTGFWSAPKMKSRPRTQSIGTQDRGLSPGSAYSLLFSFGRPQSGGTTISL